MKSLDYRWEQILERLNPDDQLTIRHCLSQVIGLNTGKLNKIVVGNWSRYKKKLYLPSDTNDTIVLGADALRHILKEHPDDFNQAFGFIYTLNFPERFEYLPNANRVRLYARIFGGFDIDDGLNRVVVKLTPHDTVNYVNSSYSVPQSGKPRDINKMKKWIRTSRAISVALGGTPDPASPEGVGQRNLPTSRATDN